MNKIIKTTGPDVLGKLHGHCYDGTGWIVCDFWYGHGTKDNENGGGESRCMLFGGKDGIKKHASKALACCDKIYGTSYDGEMNYPDTKDVWAMRPPS